MKAKKYETLDEYLDDLDAIKAKIADETKGMTAEEVAAYFGGARKRLEEKTGLKLRLRQAPRAPTAAKPRSRTQRASARSRR
jgi:hypothetical protein